MHLFRRKARPKVKLLPRQKIWLAIVIITNLALWLIPSDVVEDIARDRHTMLGRYSRQHFTWNVAIGLISIVSFYIDWSKGETYKRRWFQVIAVTTFAVPGLILLDFFLRTPETGHYIKTSLAFHHPPDGSWGREFVDKPEAHRTYPNAPPGYGSLDCTLHTDSRGFRNTTEHEQYDVVAIGDSFTEGSNVSDEHPWPQQLADISGLRVYNMGMSGYDPIHYLAALQEHALPLKPKIVLCMIYEGNDFRSAKADQKRTAPSLSSRFKEYLKQSPILATTDRFLIDTFGPINSTGHVNGVERLNWMPLRIPDGPAGHAYAFDPKQLRDLYQSPDDFALDKHWLAPRSHFEKMHDLCRKAGVRFVLLFAPLKAHVTLPLVADTLPADNVRTFTMMKFEDELPESQLLLTRLAAWADAKEFVIGQWCQRNEIPFLSLTEALQSATLAGQQTYYTYDQHWTPIGHEVVARRVHQLLRSVPISAQATASSH
jgi:hypothetical protein